MDFRFYHLDSNPFVAHAVDHLFWNAMHQSVWNGLLERIDMRQGITGVLGQAGLGKSTLLQTYRASVDPKYVHVIDGIDATQSQGGLLTSLAQACGLTLSEGNPEALLSAVYQHCQAIHACGRQVVWMIDDAHTLSTTALGNLHRLFERLHREGEPLIQMVLCGRPALHQHCQHADLYLFEQALPTFLMLSPLAAEDRAAYIQHYLQSAGAQATKIFTKGALKLIADQTHGIPNIINITCSDVLVAGLLAAEKPISVTTVQSVLGDDAVRLPPIVRWGLVSAAGLLLMAGLWNILPTVPQTSPRTAATDTSPAPRSQALPQARSEAPFQTSLVPTATVKAQLITALPLDPAAVSEPQIPPQPPVATPSEAASAIREFRKRQQRQNAPLKAAEADRDAINATQDQTDDVKPPRDVAPEPVTPAPVDATRDTQIASADTPSPVIRKTQPEAPVVPAAFVSPETIPRQRLETPEALARLNNGRHRNGSPKARQTQPTRTRPALIASIKARLLCAMPRTGGQPGSDIVLLGHTRYSVHRLIDDGSQNMSPVLSPDGIYLAYTSCRDGAPNIYLRNLTSGQETRLTSGPWLTLPGTWSPNGRYLSLSQSVKGNNDIFIYDMTQQRLRRLTQHKGLDVSPSFAPDSQRLVFSSDRTGSPQLYLTDITGTPPVRLTRTGAYNTSPSWSPRDDTIAFVGRSQNRALDLYTIKPDGTERKRLTRGQRFHTPPAWLPDGHTLMGMSLRGAAWERHLVQLHPDRAAPILPKSESLCLAPQWVAYRAP
ncbi:MAG: hypothetical protein ETSY2_28785 [Candidatus Entotheonella gemina]|uniref:ORC1/DEAH AAA+ ATPase domain-containing protein n=1 Tax=Candidatus Entotheonella gemina TaxID=1429439 RepID=W4M3A4_9BACT|nr:MAG: hypothetical protein ETSY2_28785 [Candidatus Entotheonella gemina]